MSARLVRTPKVSSKPVETPCNVAVVEQVADDPQLFPPLRSFQVRTTFLMELAGSAVVLTLMEPVKRKVVPPEFRVSCMSTGLTA